MVNEINKYRQMRNDYPDTQDCINIVLDRKKDNNYRDFYLDLQNKDEDKQEENEENNTEINWDVINHYGRNNLYKYVFPPCIINMIHRSEDTHLKNDERDIFVKFFFSLGDFSNEEIYEIYKNLLNPQPKTEAKTKTMDQ